MNDLTEKMKALDQQSAVKNSVVFCNKKGGKPSPVAFNL